MSYRVSPDLYDDAASAILWYEARGMKVAKPPGIPRAVAQWILLHCEKEESDDDDDR